MPIPKLTESLYHRAQEAEDAKAIARIGAYLDRLPNGHWEYVPPKARVAFAARCYRRGRDLGLRWTDKLCLFAYLARDTGGEALTAPEVEVAMTEPGADPHHIIAEAIRMIRIQAAADEGSDIDTARGRES